MWPKVAFCFFLAIAGPGIVDTAHACSCVKEEPPEEAMASASVVFRGVITNVERAEPLWRSHLRSAWCTSASELPKRAHCLMPLPRNRVATRAWNKALGLIDIASDMDTPDTQAGCQLCATGFGMTFLRTPANGRRAPVPRHNEIKNSLCRLVRRQLGLNEPA
jgi:mRNA interferase HicA